MRLPAADAHVSQNQESAALRHAGRQTPTTTRHNVADYQDLDFEPIARQVYDAFLVSAPGAPVEGLFRHERNFFIVSPAVGAAMPDGRTVQAWFDHSLRPLAMPISLVASRPVDSVEVRPRSRDELSDGFGIVRTRRDVARDLSVFLPATFPLLAVEVEERTLVVVVSRELDVTEERQLRAVVERRGDPLPLEVTIREVSEVPAVVESYMAPGHSHSLEILPARRLPTTLSTRVRVSLEDDEEFWRENYRRVFDGRLSAADALTAPRHSAGEACVVGTTFPPENVRTYFSMFSKVVLVMPLADQTDTILDALGVSRSSLTELVSRGDISFIAPQSVDRYDAGFLAQMLEANAHSVTWSRRLAAAAFADQVSRNPLLAVPGNALDRRVVLRCLARLEESSGEAGGLARAMRLGLADAWPYYEHLVHVRGAMASVGGPLARVARALAMDIWSKDYSIELGAAATSIEWASALGASFAPFESEGYSEIAHAELLLAIHSGVERAPTPLARATEFSVAKDLLVVDSDVDVFDFVHELQAGDLARFRDLVRGVARPSRTAEEVEEIVSMWNRQISAYERRPDRLRSMSLVGFALGAVSKVLGAPDLVSISAVVGAALPAALTLINEEVVGERASVGSMFDNINARLANVQPGTVLLSRMRKLVAGMK